jgi:hypothetical protein
MAAEAEAKGKCYYEAILHEDVVEMLKPLWAQKTVGWRWQIEGRDHPVLAYPLDQMMAPEVPWHYVNPEMDCFMWSDVLFESVSKQIEKTFVPSYCQQCFKVVVRPKTLKQLFALEALQIKLGRHCKCGIEVRGYVPALYGGYFYNRGLEEGLERLEEVREAVHADPLLGPDVDVFLKRSCTEMERAMGRSDEWPEPTAGQLELEALIMRTIDHKDFIQRQPEAFVRHAHRRWIEWASRNGDETYLEFTGGRPIKAPAVKYERTTEEED